MLKKNIRTNTLHGSLIRLNKIHRKMAKREFQKVDLTEGKPRLLDFIISNPGCSQREIASCCKIEPATATSILSSMEKEKLIYRERNPKDKRILNVFLTEKGIEMDEAIDIVSKTCAYTNHTILAEALEKWPIAYLEKVVPQLVPIIKELEKNMMIDLYIS